MIDTLELVKKLRPALDEIGPATEGKPFMLSVRACRTKDGKGWFVSDLRVIPIESLDSPLT